MNEGIEAYTEEFTSILNTSLMSKFLFWADHISDSIDRMDYVNTPLVSKTPSQSPMFVFRMDKGPVGTI